MTGSINILGVPFSKLTFNETIDLLAEHIQKEQPKLFHLITANPEITIVHQTDKLLQTIVKEADLITPDGIGIVIASKRKGDPIPERVTGYDLLLRLLERGNEQGWSFYFLGTDEETSLNAVNEIHSRYPNVVIAGRHNGFFSEDTEKYILNEIQQSKPNVLIIAMGAPYTDKWIHKNKHKLDGVKVVFGVGGSLDVIAGKVKPTPQIWKSMKLEWLHRLLTVPVAKGQRSRWRRQSALPKFFYRAIIKK
ncbi:WecB/TagA/CpsF family glycosyltransferase [Paenibacillus sp. J22TS3]|uniref:WecB/TagA/CpsF family glycosyltransferase n=1 Tax=Paenibacillus sp. J22TS3 TaxID=2807192 RepID=UPI001B0EC178|nr:WecB/TagA/CpsF family glycosyltransferase [Paenibacillus sp. J22TS3]GIP22936.1 acetylglucosaminyldiphosphoundecaprenol acetyl-beta-D-mannosaminyltransferase [Paenibacillus sp. J22TS3]